MANNGNLTFGEQIMRNRIRENTNKMYASRVQVLKLWLISKYLDMVQNNDIILPISVPILIEFMGYISIKMDKRTYDDLMSLLFEKLQFLVLLKYLEVLSTMSFID